MAEYTEEQKRIDYGFTFRTEQGTRVFYDLLDFTRLLRTDGEPPTAKQIMLYIMAHMIPHPEDRAKFIREEILNG